MTLGKHALGSQDIWFLYVDFVFYYFSILFFKDLQQIESSLFRLTQMIFTYNQVIIGCDQFYKICSQ